jgi:hypothetical protein
VEGMSLETNRSKEVIVVERALRISVVKVSIGVILVRLEVMIVGCGSRASGSVRYSEGVGGFSL